MKILKIMISGYRLLSDDFEIDFLTKARINNQDKADEVITIAEGLHMPTTTVFTGKNASGKSTVLSMIKMVNGLLSTGRVEFNPMDFRNSSINLSVHFYLEDNIYHYQSTVGKPKSSLIDDNPFCIFSNERLTVKKYARTLGKKIYDQVYTEVSNYVSSVEDTSLLYMLTKSKVGSLHSPSSITMFPLEQLFKLYEELRLSHDLKMKVLSIFDESIQHFSYSPSKKKYLLELRGIGMNEYSESEIAQMLSEGTRKGFILFGFSVLILMTGGTLIIDEIENSFHKNLVENVIMIFNDKRINTRNSTLIFSTHYVEILDIFRRQDNIFVMSKSEHIQMTNLYVDYNNRGELSKSNQFNNNTFETLINYERLMELKKALIREIPNTP